jgi:sugar/nucleoside kinase (ribokinase family)
VARYLTIGNLLVEDVVLPDGLEQPGRLGGDAVYAAIGARAFADDVQMAVRVGRGFPPALKRALDEAGYGDGLIASEHPTVRLRVDLALEGGSRFTFREGSGTYEQATPTPPEIPGALLERLEAVHVAPVAFAQMEALVHWARPRARVVAVDPHYQHLDADWERILPVLDAFLPSRDEAAGLLGGWPGPEEAAKELAGVGAALVCVKLGSEGSIGYDATHELLVRMPPPRGDLIDPTGCGDAFCGGFLVGLAQSGDLRTAMAYGTVAAGFVGEEHGAAHALRIPRTEAQRRLAALLSRP